MFIINGNVKDHTPRITHIVWGIKENHPCLRAGKFLGNVDPIRSLTTDRPQVSIYIGTQRKLSVRCSQDNSSRIPLKEGPCISNREECHIHWIEICSVNAHRMPVGQRSPR